MTVTPTSTLALAVDDIVDLVAQSATFQQRVATYHGVAASDANARLHIFGFDQWEPGNDSLCVRPFAVVGVTEHVMSNLCQGAATNYHPRGGLVLILVDDARFTDWQGDSAVDNQIDSYMDALNWMSGVVQDFNNVAGGGGHFNWPEIETIIEPSRSSIVDRQSDDFWIVMYGLRFGEGDGQ